jgi:peptide/nickel transport system ATP-binding protein
VVATLADRVAVMYAGRVVEVGRERDLFLASAHPYTRRLVQAIPEMSGEHALIGIPGTAPRPGHRPEGCFFAPRCDYAVADCTLAFPPREQVSEHHETRCYRWRDVVGEAAKDRPLAPARGHGERAASLLELHGVQAFHGDRQVLFDIDLALIPGHSVALVGESGSGKTTLARCIAGLHRKFNGELTFRGEQLEPGARQRGRETRRDIQYIFQSPYSSLNPRKTIAQIVGQPVRLFFELPRSEAHTRIIQTLERVRLPSSIVDRYPHELSGGERQRVAIARALVSDPALLICDEITSALDVSVQAAIVDLIAELQREMRLGLLFVTHNLALIRTIAQEVAVMSEGRIVERGSVDRVLEEPEADYTKRLLADTPTLETALAVAR